MKDFHCNKEKEGKRCGAVLGKTDGVNFHFLTQSGKYSPVLLKEIPILCHACNRVTNWKQINKKNCNARIALI